MRERDSLLVAQNQPDVPLPQNGIVKSAVVKVNSPNVPLNLASPNQQPP